MISSKFIVRKSGLKDEIFYIDYQGEYKISTLSKITGISKDKIVDIYDNFNSCYDEKLEVYYFDSEEKANMVINELLKYIKPSKRIKSVSLTEEEIEYIRRALINEDSNVIFTKNKIRESIFSKLNA
jgi:hypothetical protein